MSNQYSESVQSRINATKQQDSVSGPSLPMPRIRLHGENGQFLIRELLDGKLKKEEELFAQSAETNKWGGVIIRVAYFVESEYQPNASQKEFTREFQSFTDEHVELLERTFGESGRTSHIKTYVDYKAFKEETVAKDHRGKVVSWPYGLKVALYVWNFSRGEIIKFTFGGSALSEWFSYTARSNRKNDNCLSEPWRRLDGAEILQQVKTLFIANKAVNDKGKAYYRLSFEAHSICSDEEMSIVFDNETKVNDWANAWKKLQKKTVEVTELPVRTIGEMIHEDLPANEAEQEIRLEDIPF